MKHLAGVLCVRGVIGCSDKTYRRRQAGGREAGPGGRCAGKAFRAGMQGLPGSVAAARGRRSDMARNTSVT